MTRRRPEVSQRLKCLEEISEFPLLSALLGRRSRRFAKGAKIESGPFAFTSEKQIHPLDDFESSLIISAMAGSSGWGHLIPYNKKYAPFLPNYAGSAGGRTFPSAAGFHTVDLFFTDDQGTYFLSTKDMPPSPHNQMSSDCDIEEWLKTTRDRIVKISGERLQIPNEEPHIESHNLWIANSPGSLFAIPTADLAQHMILALCYFLQNGYGIMDDINGRNISGLEKFGHIINLDSLYPLSFAEQLTMAEATVEISTSCFSGALLLQAMGLGGWMYDGLDRHSVFGVTGAAGNKGLGFSYDKKDEWNFPNPTGLKDVFECHCPPFFSSMEQAVRAVVKRKYGQGGPYSESTPGPWTNTAKVRGSAAPHSEEFIECVTVQAQYIYDTFGKFPATLPSAYCLMFLQAFHLDLDFYDHFYKEGAYLDTHARHDKTWH